MDREVLEQIIANAHLYTKTQKQKHEHKKMIKICSPWREKHKSTKTKIHKYRNTKYKIMINICSPWRERFWSRSLPPPRRSMKMVFESKLARP